MPLPYVSMEFTGLIFLFGSAGGQLFPHMGHSALCFRISRRYSLIRRFLIVGQDVSCTQSRWTPTLVCYRFSAVTPIVSLFTRTTLTPSLTGMISTRSPFASVVSMAFISLSDSLTGFFILHFTTMHRIVKGY